MNQVCYSSLCQHPLIAQLAEKIESTWRSQLMLSPYNTPTDLGYVEGTLEGEKLTIENHCYQTAQFRKLHLELAKVGNHLDILHCVMFPRSDFALPIFGVDIVASSNQISAAIVDLSPVLPGRCLPRNYEEALKNSPYAEFSHPRALPDWGNIFSDFCLFVRPATHQEEALFLDQAALFLAIHCRLSVQMSASSSLEEQALIVAGQRHYCAQQQKNDKTRRILVRAFGVEWAERYLQTMLFDCAETTVAERSVSHCKQI